MLLTHHRFQSQVLWLVCFANFANQSCADMIFWERRGCLFATFTRKPRLFSISPLKLWWTLTFTMLTRAARARDVNMLWRSLLRIGKCLKYFPRLWTICPHSKMNSRLFWRATTVASLRSLLMYFFFGIVSTHNWILETSKLPKPLPLQRCLCLLMII